MPAEDVRVRVTEVLEDEGVPETLVEAIDKILESWATERDRRIDDSAGQAMYVQYLEEELHKLQQAKETP